MSANQPPRLSRRRAQALIRLAWLGMDFVKYEEQNPTERAEIDAAKEAIAVLVHRYGAPE
jgi:hypothetical protein